MSIAGKLELAVGADVTLNSGGWMFTDYSTSVLGSVVTDHGRADEASTTQPASMRCRLGNNSGTFTYLKRGTPIRYSINPGTGYVQWFQGQIDEITPVWPAGNSTSAEVQIVASGALRRLQQGAAITQSPIYRSTVGAPGLVTYAPMEEESGASNFATVGRVHNSTIPVLRLGTMQFGSETTLPGVQRAAVLGSDCYLSLDTAGYRYGGHWQFDWFMKFTGSNPAAETIIQRVYVNTSTIGIVDAVYGGANWGIRVYDPAGTSLGTGIFAPPTGQSTGWWHWRLMAHDAGGSATDLKLVTFPVSGGVGSFAPVTVAATAPGNAALATIFPSANLNGVAVSSWAVYDQWDFSATDSSANGYTGENAVVRMQRLCVEEGVELTVSGSSSATMGPQKPGGILALLRDCEAADGGILYDGFTAGLSYLSEQQRYNKAVTLALDTKRSQIKLPFQPTKDDANLVNDWTLSNPAGDSAQYSDETNVARNGRYASTGTVNLATTAQLRDLASWRVHVATADELRVPQLQLELIDRPELWTAALTLRPGLVVSADNLLTQFPPGTLSVVTEGLQAAIDAASWRIGINCSPFSPWDVGVLDSDPIDCGASVVSTAMTTSTTSLTAAVSDACLWSVADGSFNVTVAGDELAAPEIMTVTAVSASTTASPALVATGTGASADGFSTRTITPGLPGGATAAGNLMLMLASCRDTNAADTGMYITGAAGWEKIIDVVNMAVFAKVHTGTEVAPTLNILPFPSITGDTIIAQIASFTGIWGDPKSQLIGLSQQINGSGQDIPYPELDLSLGGVLLIWAGWKADDCTSVATLGGITEVGEVTTTAGNDATLVWDYNNSVGVPNVVSGSFVVTGGAAAISRGMVFALRSVSQTLTVTRAAAGTTARTHALGEQVHVTNALTAARQ